MDLQMDEFLANLIEFLYFFGTAAVLTVVFTVIYWAVTSHNELKLIKENSAFSE